MRQYPPPALTVTAVLQQLTVLLGCCCPVSQLKHAGVTEHT